MLVDLFFVDGEGYLISRTEPGRLRLVDRIYSKKSEELKKVLSRQIRLLFVVTKKVASRSH